MPKTRLSLLMGHSISILGIIVAAASIIIAPNFPRIFHVFFYLSSWFCLWFFPHCFTHYLVGTLAGIRFEHYFIGASHLVKIAPTALSRKLSRIPVLGIKVQRESLVKAHPSSRYIMFISGPIISMTLPFIVPLYIWILRDRELAAIFLLLSLLNLLITAILSPKVGDFYKAKRSVTMQ